MAAGKVTDCPPLLEMAPVTEGSSANPQASFCLNFPSPPSKHCLVVTQCQLHLHLPSETQPPPAPSIDIPSEASTFRMHKLTPYPRYTHMENAYKHIHYFSQTTFTIPYLLFQKQEHHAKLSFLPPNLYFLPLLSFTFTKHKALNQLQFYFDTISHSQPTYIQYLHKKHQSTDTLPPIPSTYSPP